MQGLPSVLLRVRAAPKENLGCYSAENVYGFPLTVSCDFIYTFAGTFSDTSLHLRQLRDQVRSIAPTPISHLVTTPTSFPRNLLYAQLLFIRCDDKRYTSPTTIRKYFQSSLFRPFDLQSRYRRQESNHHC